MGQPTFRDWRYCLFDSSSLPISPGTYGQLRVLHSSAILSTANSLKVHLPTCTWLFFFHLGSGANASNSSRKSKLSKRKGTAMGTL